MKIYKAMLLKYYLYVKLNQPIEYSNIFCKEGTKCIRLRCVYVDCLSNVIIDENIQQRLVATI